MRLRSRSLPLFAFIALIAGTVGIQTAVAEDVTVPDVVGLSLDKAQALLEESGLKVEVQRVPGTSIGKVTSQEPGGLCPRPRGTVIRLTVVGPTPKPGPRPDVRPPPGPSKDDPGPGEPPTGAPPAGPLPTNPPSEPPAQPAPAQPTPSLPDDPGLPPTRMPLTVGGQPIPAGALPDTSGPQVPSMLGQPAAQARRALRRWRVNVEYTLAVPGLHGKIVNQRPHAGQTLAPGEVVTVVAAVAKAPSDNHFAVPQVEETDWRSGMQALTAAGFQPQPLTVSSQQHGRILLQTPMPGSLVLRGSAVRIFIGRSSGQRTPGAEPDLPPRDPVSSEPPVQPPVKPRTPPDDGPPAGVPPTPLDAPVQPPAQPPVQPPAQPPVQPPTQPPVQPPTQPPVQPPTEPPAKPTLTLAAPALAGPGNGEAYPHKYGASFRWTAVAGASAYEWVLEEELPSGAWQDVVSKMVSGTQFRPDKLAQGRYRWRVRAVHQATKGAWSDYWRLYMY